jgi:hypothetical protein
VGWISRKKSRPPVTRSFFLDSLLIELSDPAGFKFSMSADNECRHFSEKPRARILSQLVVANAMNGP